MDVFFSKMRWDLLNTLVWLIVSLLHLLFLPPNYRAHIHLGVNDKLIDVAEHIGVLLDCHHVVIYGDFHLCEGCSLIRVLMIFVPNLPVFVINVRQIHLLLYWSNRSATRIRVNRTAARVLLGCLRVMQLASQLNEAIFRPSINISSGTSLAIEEFFWIDNTIGIGVNFS